MPRRIATAGLILYLALTIAAHPSNAANADPVLETVTRGFLATQDGTSHPKKIKLTQLIDTPAFESFDSITLVFEYEAIINDDNQMVGELVKLGKATAVAKLVKADGRTFKLGKLKGKKEDEDEVFGGKEVKLPAPIEKGDLIKWTIELKKFSKLKAGWDFQIAAGIAIPGALD